MRVRLLLPALALYLAGLSNASLISFSVNGGIVPDNSVVGATFTWNIVSAETIALAGNGNVILTLIGISHSWVGDLSFILTHGSTSVTIFNRPGFPELSSSLGSRANLSGTYAFGSAYSGDFEEAAVIANADASASSSVPPGNYLSEGDLDLFNGEVVGGDWSLRVTDQASGTVLNTTWTWSLDIQTVPVHTPEPATGALAAGCLAALILLRRRRKRKA